MFILLHHKDQPCWIRSWTIFNIIIPTSFPWLLATLVLVFEFSFCFGVYCLHFNVHPCCTDGRERTRSWRRATACKGPVDRSAKVSCWLLSVVTMICLSFLLYVVLASFFMMLQIAFYCLSFISLMQSIIYSLSSAFMFILFRANLQENVDMIKLQREVKDKSTKLQALQAKYTTLDEVGCYVWSTAKVIALPPYTLHY